ncbi:MAG: hypothetical protein HY719_13725 [Planctomycetes bacterium]|nr:hypothetical protein [Planctomycetota bacterium]
MPRAPRAPRSSPRAVIRVAYSGIVVVAGGGTGNITLVAPPGATITDIEMVNAEMAPTEDVAWRLAVDGGRPFLVDSVAPVPVGFVANDFPSNLGVADRMLSVPGVVHSGLTLRLAWRNTAAAPRSISARLVGLVIWGGDSSDRETPDP